MEVLNYLEGEDNDEIRENQEDIQNMKGGLGFIGFVVAVLTLASLIFAWLRRNVLARHFRNSDRRLAALQKSVSRLRRLFRRRARSSHSRPPGRNSIYRPSVSSPVPGPSGFGAAGPENNNNNNATYVQPKAVQLLKALQARKKDESGAADGEDIYESIELDVQSAETSVVNSIPPVSPPPPPPVRPRVPKTLDRTKVKRVRHANFESSQTSLKQVVPTQVAATQVSLNLSPASSFSPAVENNSQNINLSRISANHSTPNEDDENDAEVHSDISDENAARLSDHINTNVSHELHEISNETNLGAAFKQMFGTSTPKPNSKLNSFFQPERYSFRNRDPNLCYSELELQKAAAAAAKETTK